MQDENNFVGQELHQNCMMELDFVVKDMKPVEHIVQYLYVKSLVHIGILLVDILYDNFDRLDLHKMVHNLEHIARKLHLGFGIMAVSYNLVKFGDNLGYQL